jgi:hypothetical protein
MDQKLRVNLEVVKNERTFCFSMEAGAPLGDCYTACYEALCAINEMIKNATDKAQPKESAVDGEMVEKIN